jgi:hypothetical protein
MIVSGLVYKTARKVGSVKFPYQVQSVIRKTVPLIVILFAVTITCGVHGSHARDVTLAWLPNEESDIAGYNVWYGSESEYYVVCVDVGNQTQFTIRGLEDDKKYFYAVTAYDTSNRESGFSDEISYPSNMPVNVLTNGGFELDESAWKLNKGMTIDPGAGYSGESGLKMIQRGSAKQTFATIKGGAYTATARIRIDDEIKAPTKGGLELLVKGGSKILGRTSYLNLSNMRLGRWSLVSVPFTAAGTKTVIFFKNTGNGRFEASADAFVVGPQQ